MARRLAVQDGVDHDKFESALEHIFDDYDADGNGQLDHDEIIAMITEVKMHMANSREMVHIEDDSAFLCEMLGSENMIYKPDFVAWMFAGAERSDAERKKWAERAERNARMDSLILAIEDMALEMIEAGEV